MSGRTAKSLIVTSIGLYMCVVALNNLTDYGSNFAFVRHVLNMDTTFPDNRLRWRAIESPVAHHACYAVIIVAELITGALCLRGGVMLAGFGRRPPDPGRARRVAVAGLTGVFLLFFVGFIIVGGEWFLMWQSETWDGREAAFRIAVISLGAIIFVGMPDREG